MGSNPGGSVLESAPKPASLTNALPPKPSTFTTSHLPPQTVNPTPSAPAPTTTPGLDALGSFLEADSRSELEAKKPKTVVVNTPPVSQPATTSNTSIASQSISYKPEKPAKSEKQEGLLDMFVGAFQNIAGGIGNGTEQQTSASTGNNPAQQTPQVSNPQQLTEMDWTKECLILNIVDNPKNEGGMLQKSISFRVCSKTKLPHFQREIFAVRRTNNDFEWFRSQLVLALPYVLVPMLPEKKGAIEEMISSDEGLQVIAHQYQAFLARVTRHPTMAKSEPLRQFLEDTYEDYREKRNQMKLKTTQQLPLYLIHRYQLRKIHKYLNLCQNFKI